MPGTITILGMLDHNLLVIVTRIPPSSPTALGWRGTGCEDVTRLRRHQGLNDTGKGVWSIYLVGVIAEYGLWLQFEGSSGP